MLQIKNFQILENLKAIFTTVIWLLSLWYHLLNVANHVRHKIIDHTHGKVSQMRDGLLA